MNIFYEMIFYNLNKFYFGTFICLLLATISFFVSNILGEQIFHSKINIFSPIIISILSGMVICNLIQIPKFITPGIEFSSNYILRVGIIFLGIKLSILDVFEISKTVLPIIIICLITSILFANYMTRILGISNKMGTLIATGTSICGTSAILVTGSIINSNKEEVAYAIANITIFGICAMIIYPFLSFYFFDNNFVAIGIFLGTAIHDTSQVAGAGIIFSEQYNAPKVMQVAMITKLVRNICMILVIPIVSIMYNNKSKLSDLKENFNIFTIIPLFIFGFIVMCIIRTIGDYGLENDGFAFSIIDEHYWKEIILFFSSMSEYTLAVAMAAVGLTTNFRSLFVLGIKPFCVGLSVTLFITSLSIMLIIITF